MREDFAKYSRERKEFVQRWTLENTHVDRSSIISIMAQSSACPCIIVAYWIGEVLDWPEDIKKSVDRLIEFYGYTELLNKPKGSPW